MKSAVFTAIFSIVCVLVFIQGAMQCFAPQKLKEVQDRLRPKGDWSGSAAGAWLERLREQQATRPSLLYRLSGVALMAFGLFMLVAVLRR